MTVEPRDSRFPDPASPKRTEREMHAGHKAASVPGAPADPREELAERVLAAPLFEKSPRLRSFLRFVCEQELSGRRLSINEHEIGVHVFGRPSAYNPGEDSIVRSQARFLRQRLEEYFRTAGQNEPVRIVIPKGSYVPVFEPNTPTPPYRQPAEVSPDGRPLAESFSSGAQMFPGSAVGGAVFPERPVASSPPQTTNIRESVNQERRGGDARAGSLRDQYFATGESPRPPQRGFVLLAGLLGGLAIAIVGLALLFMLVPGVPGRLLPGFVVAAPIQSGPEQRFWKAIFDPHRAAVVVPADSTLILIEELTGKPVTLQGYLNRDYLTSMPLAVASSASAPTLTAGDLATSHYTSMADLNLVARLSSVPEMTAAHVEIRSARELSISDAKEDNLVLIGGPRANPWVELFANRMNFYVDYDWALRSNTVINKAPKPGEQPFYAETSSDAAHRVYGLIAFQPSLDHEGDALLVAGTSSAGTQTAADFLLNGRTFGAFLHGIERPDGAIPHFEILLEARSLGGNVPQSTVVASRLLP